MTETTKMIKAIANDSKVRIDRIVANYEQLEKENVELKEKVNILDNCDRLGDVITEAYKDQLTKAKELLKQFLKAKNGEDTYKAEWEAEQFLSEVEK